MIDGHDLLLDEGDSLALASGSYEPEEASWYARTVNPGDLVVELGANIGYFSLLLARAAGPTGRVISYEPDPDLSRILDRNATANGYTNIDIRTAAVADRTGTMTYYRDRKNTGDNRLFTHGRDRDSFSVPVVTLDEDLGELDQRIDLVKMDIQGAEPLALDGMAGLLAERPPSRMLIEFWPHGILGMDRDPRGVLETLRQAGYRITKLDEDTELDFDSALREMTAENQRWTNLVCVRETAV